jgi:hypothetical protein
VKQFPLPALETDMARQIVGAVRDGASDDRIDALVNQAFGLAQE